MKIKLAATCLFGLEKLLGEELDALLISHAHLPPEMLAETVVSHADGLSAGRRDDMTVVVGRVSLRDGRTAA